MISPFRKTITGVRVAIWWVEGNAKERSREAITILGSLQPATMDELQFFPEARRITRSYWIFTDDVLYCFGDPSHNPDRLFINDEWFEVVQENTWANTAVGHRKYLLSHITAITVKDPS
jgi:hypothetical protein